MDVDVDADASTIANVEVEAEAEHKRDSFFFWVLLSVTHFESWNLDCVLWIVELKRIGFTHNMCMYNVQCTYNVL